MKRPIVLKIIFFSLFFASFILHSYSQEEPPEIFPNSPTAAELGSYGSYPVNYSTGLPNIEIPLYTIEVGDLKVPITLKYHASGIKVNQQVSWVGLGWSLDTGGIISLETRDTPDELEPLIYDTPEESDFLTFFQNNPYAFNHIDFAKLKNYSWVKDAYNINLPTVNGSFFLNSNSLGEVDKKFPPDEFKIYKGNSLQDSYYYKVIDKQGVKYYFNDFESSEMKKTTSTADNWYHLYNTPYKSAWLLNKIENHKGDVVSYTYGKNYTVEVGGKTHSQSYSYNRSLTHLGAQTYQANMNNAQTSLSRSINYANKLTQIDFKNGRIRFITSNNPQYDGVYNAPGIYLDKIIIETGNNVDGFVNLKTIDFNYSTIGNPTVYPISTTKYRFSLDNILEITNNGAGDVKEIASFEYYSSAILPSYNSNSLDYFGYYNGMSNSNLIPRRYISYKSSLNGPLVPTEIGGGNRSIDQSKMKAGVLTRITYPTKGYTSFDYEPNSYYGKNVFLHDNLVSDWISLAGIGNGNTAPVPGPGEPPYATTSKSFYTSKQTTLNIKNNINCINCPGGYAHYAYAKYYVKVNNVIIAEVNMNTNTIENQYTIGPGNVDIIVEAYGDTIEARIDYFYWDKADQNDQNVEGFGLRVKSITNFDYNNNFINKKEYDYITPGTSNSSGKLMNWRPEYDLFNAFSSHSESNCSLSTWTQHYTTSYTYSSSSKQGLENNGISYEYVTEYEKDSQGNANGRTEYKFSIEPNQYVDTENNTIWLNNQSKTGNLLEKKIFNDTNKLLMKEENFFSDNSLKSSLRDDFKLYCNVYTSGSASNCQPPPYTLLNSKWFRSSLKLNWHKKDRTELTNYFYNASGTLINQLKTTTDYTYGSFNQEIQKTTTTNSDQVVLETSYKYAQDLNDSQLIAENRISVPLETKTMAGSQITNHKKTTYSPFGSFYLPNRAFSKKGALVDINNSDDLKLTFDSYENGNITQYHIENDPPTSIIWGYNEQYPIAKIENATYSQVSSQVANLQALSNADDGHCLDTENCNEKYLRNALTGLRTLLPNAMVTTYTYDPLIGVTSTTDPSGYISYYVYDEFNRLRYAKNKDGEIVGENKYHYKLDDIIASTTSSSTSVNSGNTVTLTTTATGGTGVFTYKWTVSNANLNQVYNTTTGTLSITTTNNHAPSFTVTCEVTDTNINEKVSTTKQINVSLGPPPLAVNGITVSPTGSKSINQNVTYSVSASGGSGNYSYVWKKTNTQSTTTYSGTTSNSKIIQIKTMDCPSFSISCTVTDTTTNEVITKSVSIYISSGCGGPGID